MISIGGTRYDTLGRIDNTQGRDSDGTPRERF